MTMCTKKNSVFKIFIVSLGNLIELKSTPQSQAVNSSDYELVNQPITVHIVLERCNTKHHIASFCITEAVYWKHGKRYPLVKKY